jgi:hypothetical protein
MDSLPPGVGRLLLRFLAWLSVILLGTIVTIGWWRLSHIVLELREIDRRLTRIETTIGISHPPEVKKE